MFRFKRSVPVSYDRQGYIYFASRLFQDLPQKQKQEILDLCRECGGEYSAALLEFVTTGANATQICMKYSISRSTLERAVRRYYVNFGK